MKLAHLLPIPIIEATPDRQTVHLALAPLVVKHSRYADFLRKKLLRGDTVIVDNPIHENVPADITVWLAAIRAIRVSPSRPGSIVAVIPDTIDDDSLTVKQAETYAPLAEALSVQIMAVPHGIEQRDFFSCANKLAKVPGITHLGISLERRFDDDEIALQRRLERLGWIRNNEELDSTKVHLLGISEAGHEFIDNYVWSRAESVDSSKFAVFALAGMPQAPGPITRKYPGRVIFGGSMEYFSHIPKFRPHGKDFLTRHLTIWNAYAERFDGNEPR